MNSSADDFCPTAHRNGKDFLFVSSRAGGCGGADIYATRLHATRGWSTPHNLGCNVNSAADEASPYLLEDELYFSSTRAGGFAPEAPGAVTGDGDIYASAFDGESFGAPALASGLNTALNDLRPNLRRDGLELFFDSNRAGGIGGLDLWSSSRASTSAPWPTPTNRGRRRRLMDAAASARTSRGDPRGKGISGGPRGSRSRRARRRPSRSRLRRAG